VGVLNIMLLTGEHRTPGREMHDLGACRVTHGPCDSYFENLAGKTVASVRRSLATVFSIPDDAEAWACGSVVDDQYRLRAGDLVEFLHRGRGRKGVLGPEELALLEEEGLTLAEAAALLPGRKPGKRLYVNTVWRWCVKGLRGVRLRSVLVGGQRLTTRRWLQEFIQAMSEARDPGGSSPPMIRTPRQRQSASERAAEELKAAWKQRRRPAAEGGAPPTS
jgi:hypothetical protein